ncbi:MAG: ATP-binding cassette domain-containing protein [Calditrichaeota bacterium]|nr:ATP-binding cassette domain-containing protein [Calditrichota bacterium]
MNSLILDRISKSYNTFRAVDRVSFAIGDGQLFGLLGPNGAGKTTTMRMIMNIIVPDSGKIVILGQSFRESLKNKIGYLPEERGLYPKMKLVSHLQFLGEMKGMEAAKAKKKAYEWLERFQLGKWAGDRIQNLSKGMQQKVQFIGAVIHSPELLIVDEPFAGLDPINTRFLKDILLEMKKAGKSILLSTHLMDQAEKLCDSICLINKGQVLLRGEINQIKQKYSYNSVLLEYQGDSDFVHRIPFVRKIDDYGNFMELRLDEDADPQELFKLLAGSGLIIKKFEISDASLNEIFIEQVKGSEK